MKNALGRFTIHLFLVFLLLPVGSLLAIDYTAEGNKLVNEKKYQEAVQSYKQALAEEPNNSKVKSLLSLTLAQTGDMDGAIQYAKEVAASDPESYSAFYNLGLIYASRNELPESLKSFNQALELSPESMMAEYQRGLVYAAMENYDDAILAYKNALKINPYLHQARIALVGAYLKINDRKSAAEQIEEFRKMKEDDFAKILEERLKKSGS